MLKIVFNIGRVNPVPCHLGSDGIHSKGHFCGQGLIVPSGVLKIKPSRLKPLAKTLVVMFPFLYEAMPAFMYICGIVSFSRNFKVTRGIFGFNGMPVTIDDFNSNEDEAKVDELNDDIGAGDDTDAIDDADTIDDDVNGIVEYKLFRKFVAYVVEGIGGGRFVTRFISDIERSESCLSIILRELSD